MTSFPLLAKNINCDIYGIKKFYFIMNPLVLYDLLMLSLSHFILTWSRVEK